MSKIDRWIKRERATLGDEVFNSDLTESDDCAHHDVEYETDTELDEGDETHRAIDDVHYPTVPMEPLSSWPPRPCACRVPKFKFTEYLHGGGRSDHFVNGDSTDCCPTCDETCESPTTFEVSVAGGKQKIKILSPTLTSELETCLPATLRPVDGCHLHLAGADIATYRQIFTVHLNVLRSATWRDPLKTKSFNEMDLFIHKFLNDAKFFPHYDCGDDFLTEEIETLKDAEFVPRYDCSDDFLAKEIENLNHAFLATDKSEPPESPYKAYFEEQTENTWDEVFHSDSSLDDQCHTHLSHGHNESGVTEIVSTVSEPGILSMVTDALTNGDMPFSKDDDIPIDTHDSNEPASPLGSELAKVSFEKLQEAMRNSSMHLFEQPLESGARKNNHSTKGDSPLAIALPYGHEEIFQMDHGATANPMFGQGGLTSRRPRVFSKSCVNALNKPVEDITEECSWRYEYAPEAMEEITNDMNISSQQGGSERLRTFRLNFIIEYRRMIKASRRSTTNFKRVFRRLPNYKNAWHRGIEFFRGLSNLELEPSLESTLSLMCIARAIVESICDDHAHMRDEFVHDLSRWEHSFSNHADLLSYQEAVKLIWNISLEGGWEPNNPESFRQFMLNLRDRAANLILLANEDFGIVGSCSSPVQGCQNNDFRSANAFSPERLDYILAPHIAEINQRSRYHPKFKPGIVNLVTSAIFALVVYFFADPMLISRPSSPFQDIF
ncbi:unnamed protein product [Clonostachys solani]|uniref:Uncharacterized protein n=1 Tax=Clonostachys solani TaxID=160281 RepID=A0A9N9Z7P5_9HYPO|nr:unnamed protein product [Clonostachys solani]